MASVPKVYFLKSHVLPPDIHPCSFILSSAAALCGAFELGNLFPSGKNF